MNRFNAVHLKKNVNEKWSGWVLRQFNWQVLVLSWESRKWIVRPDGAGDFAAGVLEPLPHINVNKSYILRHVLKTHDFLNFPDWIDVIVINNHRINDAISWKQDDYVNSYSKLMMWQTCFQYNDMANAVQYWFQHRFLSEEQKLNWLMPVMLPFPCGPPPVPAATSTPPVPVPAAPAYHQPCSPTICMKYSKLKIEKT